MKAKGDRGLYMEKKIISMLLCAGILLSCWCGCTQSSQDEAADVNAKTRMDSYIPTENSGESSEEVLPELEGEPEDSDCLLYTSHISWHSQFLHLILASGSLPGRVRFFICLTIIIWRKIFVNRSHPFFLIYISLSLEIFLVYAVSLCFLLIISVWGEIF